MKSFNFWTRKVHRWLAILFFIPLFIVIASGLLLQIKKEWTWVQPPTQRGVGGEMTLHWQEILEIVKRDPHAATESWADISRMDIRPKKAIAKIQTKNSWELQIDLVNGSVLSSTYRRSDWIESLHDGSWFGDFSKYWIFLTNGIALLFLWASGLYLWYLPYRVRSQKRKRVAAKARS